jgi:hypothetical protein
MNSRRRIASPQAQDHAKFGSECRRSNQEKTTDGIGFNGQFALQKFRAAHVRVGSKAEVVASYFDVHSYPNNGHSSARSQCLLFGALNIKRRPERNNTLAGLIISRLTMTHDNHRNHRILASRGIPDLVTNEILDARQNR